jgi:mono/diheme cytochrome c family protein
MNTKIFARGWISQLGGALSLLMAFATMTAPAHAEDADEAAYRNYVLNCMGCHGPNGDRVPGKIPPLRDSLGWFVHSPAGRQFIIKVPGASNSALSDEELAQVTNLLLKRFNAATLPPDFKPYTASEVAANRKPAFTDVKTVRSEVINKLHSRGVPIPADY